MIYIVKAGKNKSEFIEKIDRHIWSDTDLELPDWGKYKQYHKGLHFVRKGDKIKGICRFNDWNEKEAQYKWKKHSIHLRFVGKLYTKKNGEARLFLVTFPQLSFWFLLGILTLLTFAFTYKQDVEKTWLISGPLCMGLTVTVIDQLLLEFRFLKEIRAFFKRKG